MPAITVKSNIPELQWNDYLKFTVVRNPFDKLISAFYHYVIDHKSGLDDVAQFRQYIAEGGKVIDRGLYTIDDEVCVDYFIKYENLIGDIKIVCEKLMIEYDSNDLPQLKSGYRSQKYNIKDFYDEETEEIVKKLYRFEIERFGYTL
jgi:hypothetical protein